MASSYTKINHAFLKSQEWRDMDRHFVEMLQHAGVSRIEFEHDSEYHRGELVPIIKTYFIFRYDAVELKRLSTTDIANFTFPSGDALPEDYLNRTPELLFGTRGYPTYNCKKDKVLTNWPEFARKQLVGDNREEVNAFEIRTRQQMVEMLGSLETVAAKKRFYERGVIDEICKVVLKYYDKVGPEVLKEALDEVVCHAIQES